MRLITEGESIKIQNFVEYLIENYNEKGKTYDFEIHVEDRYDKKSLENRENSLKDKVLVLHNDGFEILSSDCLSDLVKFKDMINQLVDSKEIAEEFTTDNFASHFVHYKVWFIEHEFKHQFDFSYINLSK